MRFESFREAAYYACREEYNRQVTPDYREERHEEKFAQAYDAAPFLWHRLCKLEVACLFNVLERRGYDIDALIHRISEDTENTRTESGQTLISDWSN